MAAVTVSLAALVNTELTLAKIASLPLPVKTAYRVSKLVKIVGNEVEEYHTRRNALVKDLGAERDASAMEKARGSSDKVFEVTPENMPVFMEKMKELGAIPVTITDWLLSVDQLSSLSLTASEIMAIECLFDPAFDQK